MMREYKINKAFFVHLLQITTVLLSLILFYMLIMIKQKPLLAQRFFVKTIFRYGILFQFPTRRDASRLRAEAPWERRNRRQKTRSLSFPNVPYQNG